ncbi:MAG: transcription elongation factor GreA [Bacteroidetes bacterium]|nr:transcription elongation factor GreA [Candidatus Colenecus caballi]
MEYLSQERYDEIAAELDNLINVEFPKIKDAISEARAQGDLSENYEYHAARRAQSKMIGRIKFLQNVLKFSRVIDPGILPGDKVTLLSKVCLTNLDTNQKMTYTIVSPHEMDLKSGKISLKSPMGQALLGKKPGDEVTVHAPAATFRLRIDSISIAGA